MPRCVQLLVLFLIICSLHFVLAEDESEPECTIAIENTGNIIDLRKLRRESGDDWEVTNDNSEVQYKLNVCHATQRLEGMGAYVKESGDGPVGLGKYSSKLEYRNNKAVLTYKTGDPCKYSSLRRASVIFFSCDKSVDESNAPVFVADVDKCVYVFEWRTPVACPVPKNQEGMTGVGLFFTIFFIALLVYFVGGIFYNRMVHHASGISQIPNSGFWKEAWCFVRDMTIIICAQLSLSSCTRSSQRYRNVPVEESNILIEEEE
ncbi:2292_t:CDS:2 [Paraglomus occultum]|uniref:2292_t:CDS:1 n=1 Tax=Paraglomus occultum TaxID=144539 RepID=A0A9N9G9K5_9GLOM|nr:2292_t:CDS:2 [Paraglomus occultum]